MTLQGNAKQKYAVTDGDLQRLGTLEKPNPQYKQGAPMHLYVEYQASASLLRGIHTMHENFLSEIRHMFI